MNGNLVSTRHRGDAFFLPSAMPQPVTAVSHRMHFIRGDVIFLSRRAAPLLHFIVARSQRFLYHRLLRSRYRYESNVVSDLYQNVFSSSHPVLPPPKPAVPARPPGLPSCLSSKFRFAVAVSSSMIHLSLLSCERNSVITWLPFGDQFNVLKVTSLLAGFFFFLRVVWG